jgi:hypothetical protein
MTIIVFKSYYFILFVFQNIFSIIAIMSIKIIVIISIIDTIAIIYSWSHMHTKVVYGYRYWPQQPECIRIHQRHLSQQKYCEFQLVSAPPFWPTPAWNRRLAQSLILRSNTTGTLQSPTFGLMINLPMHCRQNQVESLADSQSRR